jgi:hypothetical protein
MNFINPILLVFAAAASVPLLLHLFSRQRVKIVEFSTVKYLQTLQKTRMRKLRIRQILLLLLRTLILIAIALAFARPTVEGGYFQSLGAKGTTTAVMLLDISASTGTETAPGSIFERANIKATEIVSTFTQKEKATILAFASDIVVSSGEPSSDFERLQQFLQELEPVAAESNPALALRHAYELLEAAADPNLEIYLISDLQGEPYRKLQFDLFESENLPVKLFTVPIISSGVENVAVEELDFPNQIITAGRPFEVEAQITNHKAELSADLLVTLNLSGAKVAQSNLALPPGGSGRAVFSGTAGRSGWLYGSVGIDDDDLLSDNSRYFAMRIPSTLNLALIADSEREAFLIEKALTPLSEERETKRIEQLTVDQSVGANLFDYDVVMVDLGGTIPSPLRSSLDTYLSAGGAVLFFSPPTLDLKSFSNRFASPVFGVTFTELPSPPEPGMGRFLLDQFDLDHPIFVPYKDYGEDQLPQVQFYSHFQLLESPAVNVLARLSDNSPAVLEALPDEGRSLLFTFNLNEDYSDMAAHPLMVILLNRAVEYLVSEPLRQREDLLVGQEITRVVSSIAQKHYALVNPYGDTLNLSPTLRAREVVFNLGRLDYPGIYRIVGDDVIVDMFTLNQPNEESELSFLEPGKLEEKISGARLILMDENDDPEVAIAGARFGKELWKLFILIGFILMLLEMAIAAGGRQTEARSS